MRYGVCGTLVVGDFHREEDRRGKTGPRGRRAGGQKITIMEYRDLWNSISGPRMEVNGFGDFRRGGLRSRNLQLLVSRGCLRWEESHESSHMGGG